MSSVNTLFKNGLTYIVPLFTLALFVAGLLMKRAAGRREMGGGFSPLETRLFVLTAALMGASLLSFFSVFQKWIIGSSLHIRGFIIPMAFGASSGSVIGYFFIRILRQKEAIGQKNREIEKREKRYRELFNLLPHGAEIVNDQGIILDCSENSARMLGYTREEMMGKPVTAFMGEDSGVCFQKAFETRGDKKRLQGEFTLVRKDGSRLDVLRSGVRLSEASENERSWLCINMDITERNEAQRAKEAIMEQLYHHRRLDALGKLVGVAHDFNNVLSGIAGAASVLSLPESGLDEEGLEFVKLVLQATKRGSALTSRLLTFSKKEDVVFEPTDINQVLQDSVAILKRTVAKNVAIELELGTKEAVISGYASALENALINMGINASHAMPQGGTFRISTARVTLSEDACLASPFPLEPGEYLQMKLRDTGMGIPKEHLSQIFEPFFTTKAKGKGTGLGLSAVYGILKDHRGAIAVESSFGEGTCFTLHLPFIQANQRVESITPTGFLGHGEVLLVEDDLGVQKVGHTILSQMGFNVTACDSGEEGVALIREAPERFAFVLMDLVLPGMSGQEACVEVRKINPDLKVVPTSGLMQPAQVDTLLKKGMVAFVKKPYFMSDLARVFRGMVG